MDPINAYLSVNAYALVAVLARVGAALMVLPGFSASYVPARVRLLLALAVSVLVLPIVRDALPPPPPSTPDLIALIMGEVFIGAFIGLLAQGLLLALHLAGTAIGRESGLANAMVFDAVSEQQSALINGFLLLLALVLIFILGLHHLTLEALVHSYTLFPPGTLPMFGDHAAVFADLVQDSSLMAMRLAAPFMVFAIAFQTAMGMLARISPQLNVFFVVLPLQILLSLGLLWVAVPAMMLWFLRYFEEGFLRYTAG